MVQLSWIIVGGCGHFSRVYPRFPRLMKAWSSIGGRRTPPGRRGPKGGIGPTLAGHLARAALQVADEAYVLETVEVVLSGPARELSGNPRVTESYLGLGKTPGSEDGAALYNSP
jgi:hypothetical protein